MAVMTGGMTALPNWRYAELSAFVIASAVDRFAAGSANSGGKPMSAAHSRHVRKRGRARGVPSRSSQTYLVVRLENLR